MVATRLASLISARTVSPFFNVPLTIRQKWMVTPSVFLVSKTVTAASAGDDADIADLSAAFGVERCFIEYKREFAFVNAVKAVVAVNDGKHLCTVCLEYVIAGKFGFGKRA